jgi:Flp pilus assembly pilin Flp
MNALQGNREAAQQIATTMNADFNQINSTLCAINSGLQRELAAANGNVNLASERILNGISQQTGILGSQIQNTGCGIKTSILEQGYQNQIQNLNQTNQLGNNIQNAFNALNTTILSQGYQNQLANCQQTNNILQGFNSLTNTVQNGFTSIGYQLNTIGCDIKQNSTINTQKIIDYLVGTKQLDQATTIQQLRDEIGRLQQTNTIISQLKSTTPTTGA